jgi:hypothetical protein
MPQDWKIIIATVFTSVGGSSFVSKILTDRMLARFTAKSEKELEQLKLAHAQSLASYQHEFDKTILVTKVHFETEFAALKEGFQKLAEVRLRMASVRPSFEVRDAGETQDYRHKALFERTRMLTAAYNDLIATTENLYPFYPKDIYYSIDECRQAVHAEIIDIQISGDETFKTSWYTRGAQNNERFMKAYNTVADLIRDHIASLAIARRA